MKTVNLYNFNELSEYAREVALDSFEYSDGDLDHISSDALMVLDTFREKIGAPLNRYDCHTFIDYTGLRLHKLIYNRFFDVLFKPKYIGYISGDKPINHKRIKTVKVSLGYYNSYYSSILKTDSCVLTGICYDDDILKPIYDFLKEPNDYMTIDKLINQCHKSLESVIEREQNWYYEDEGKTDYLESHDDIWFTEQGTYVPGIQNLI
jgi:hypothetical protein